MHRFRSIAVVAVSLSMFATAADAQHSSVLPSSLNKLLGGKAFHDWVTGNNGPTFAWYGPPYSRRRCKQTLDCDNQIVQTFVSIYAASDANGLDLGAVPPTGVVVAVMAPDQVFGKYIEFRYDLPYGRDSAYFVVEKGPSAKEGKWSLVLANAQGSKVLKTGKFVPCNDAPSKPAQSYATFGSCASNHAAAQAAFARLRDARDDRQRQSALAALAAAMGSRGQYDDPAWMSCIYGCCIAE